MIPRDLSTETQADAVPDIWIDPIDHQHLVARPGRTDAPLLVSRDGGDTWSRRQARAAVRWPGSRGPATEPPAAGAAELARLAGIVPQGNDVAAAADPRDPGSVFLAWVESARDSGTRLCLRRSADGGATWSPDLRIIPQAQGAGLAVNQRGEVALVYRQLTGLPPEQRWVVYLEHSANAFATMTQWVLADTPAKPDDLARSDPAGARSRVIALADAFYGAFVADNTPNPAHFPNGVAYQRHADFDALRLLDAAGGATVTSSYDPFFFRFSAAV